MADRQPSADVEYDLLLVGGGLASGLIALSCLARSPGMKLALLERDASLGGNHTWCLHPNDVPEHAARWLQPLLVHSWDGYDVRFPGLSRRLSGRYAAVTSERLDAVLQRAFAGAPNAALGLGAQVQALGEHRVELTDGRVFRARLVIDARGPLPQALQGRTGYQKFLGLELELAQDSGLERPILMDACVEQRDGFRFFYVLPLAPNRLLVEDTAFSRDARLDPGAARSAVLDYAQRFGRVRRVVREERGLLPMTFRSEVASLDQRPLLAGYRAGLFHPATGYSFPIALRFATALAQELAAPNGAFEPGDALGPLLDAHRSQFAYAERLNWLLFHGFLPDQMWRVFERFYRLPEPLIHRFYALELTRADRARILLGAPPRGLSLRHALTHFTPSEVTP